MSGKLTKKQIEDALVYLDGWRQEGKALVRNFEFDDLEQIEAFTSQVTMAAEEANHHPELTVDGMHLTIKLTSHDTGGVTDRDTDLAEAIQDLAP